MKRLTTNIVKHPWLLLCCVVAVLGIVVVLNGCTTSRKSTAYQTPEDAVTALVNAARSGSEAQVMKALGAGSDDIVDSGDQVADEQRMTKFLTEYDKHHEFRTEPNGRMILLIGDDNWPFPIPLVKGESGWTFDVAAGKEEILARRIGQNEDDAMRTCMAIVDAQRDYAAMNPTHSDLPEYAQKFASDDGRKNGLYWKVSAGEAPSPLGPLVADAADEGYTLPAKTGEHTPYHGYFYRILRSQGPAAPGGARDYLVDGKMIGGFALIAYPADYGNSGIMTFMVSYDGILRQADLGEETVAKASKITAYDPGPEWRVTQVEEPTTEPAKP